jgi:acetyl esterase/lipase
MVGNKSVIITALLLVCFANVEAQRRKDMGAYIKVPDVRYANNSPRDPGFNSLDIYMPKKGSNSPVLLWIHGGSWAYGDKETIHTKPDYFTSKGYLFVSMNYRYDKQQTHDESIGDLASAIVWLKENLKHYSGDPDNIFLVGHSFGAHLAALVTLDETYLKSAGGSLSGIKGVVLLDGGGYDISKVLANADSKLKDWYVDVFGKSRKDWEKFSPVNQVKPGVKKPPFLIIHAGNSEFAEMEANQLAKSLKGANHECKVIHYPKENHASIAKTLGRDNDKPTEDVLRFLLNITSPFPAVN